MGYNYVTSEYAEDSWEINITDLDDHPSTSFDCRGFQRKTFIFYNTHDKQMKYQVQADRDENFSNPFNIGNPVLLSAGHITLQKDYVTSDEYFPWYRVVVTCNEAEPPTEGTSFVFCEKTIG
jgi:hypothetical protein